MKLPEQFFGAAMSEPRPGEKYLVENFASSLFPLILVGVFLSALGLASCGNNDDFNAATVRGQALRPVSQLVDRDPVPLAGATVTLIDYSDVPVGRELMRTTMVGTTDINGNFSVEVPNQQIAAIVVNGTVNGVSYRSSGLIRIDEDNILKNFNGATDIACEALINAINDGQVDPTSVIQPNIDNLEDAAAREIENTDFTDPASVTASATKVALATNNGESEAPVDENIGLNCENSQTSCEDGTPVCSEQYCNGIQDCPDGSDENSSTCGDEISCCLATAGCPAETASECSATCCCCNLNSVCDLTNFTNGCVSSEPTGVLANTDSPLSKLLRY